MSSRVLRLRFLSNCVELNIPDTDKCLLIDVLNDMYNEYKKRGYDLPQYPVLHYGFRAVSHYLTDDKSLMQLFENVKTKKIDVWIGCLDQPNFIWTLAQKVRNQTPNNQTPNNQTPNNQTPINETPINQIPPTVKPRLDKLPITRPTQASKAPVHEASATPKSPNTTSPRRSLRITPTDESFAPHTCSPPKSPNPLSSPRRSKRINPAHPDVITVDPNEFHISSTSQPTPSSHTSFSVHAPSLPLKTHPNFHPSSTSHLRPQPTQATNATPSSNIQTPSSTFKHSTTTDKPTRNISKPPVFPHGKKMGRSTAYMKKLWVPKATTKKLPERSVEAGRNQRKRTALSLKDFDETHTDCSSDNESEYLPKESDDESEDATDMDLEDGDIQELLSQNYVDGDWDPLRPIIEFEADDCGYLGRVYKNGEVCEDTEFGRIRLKLWQLYVDKDHFRDTLREFCIQEGFSLMVERADNIRYTAHCADIRCNWSIHAAVLPDGFTWAIKKLGKTHQCDMNLVRNPMCSSEWAAKQLLDDIKANPTISGKACNDLLRERFGVTMADSSIYRMKQVALVMLQGGHDESYTNLPQYCEILKQNNPGSIAFCTWRTLHQPQKALQFTSIFISFEAQFGGLLNGCRGLVGVDGCHLKGSHGGILLSAISLDGNNEIFPVAVAVVDSENKNSWTWFFDILKKILTQTGREKWCIMSDRQKGIDPSLDVVWPKCPRRYCGRHLCKNFKADYPGLLMHKLFWGVVNAYSAFTFRKAMQQVLLHGGLGAVKWFKDLGPLDRWARWQFDPSLCNDENTNNFVESFNSTIGVDRGSPVLTMLEGVRRVAMVRHATRQHVAEQWPDDGICPNVVQMLRVITKDSRVTQAYPSGRGNYEVHDGRAKLPVSLTERTCACGRWQLSGIPCKHAVKAILHEGKEPKDYVSDWFSVAKYKEAYAGNIAPVPDQEQWPLNSNIPQLIAPTMKRGIGRPSRNRKREEGEQRKGKRSTTVTCGKCKGYGHNSVTCKGGNTKKELAEQAGKPTAEKNGQRKKQQVPTSTQAMLPGTNLIEMLIEGNAEQWVDPSPSECAGGQSQFNSHEHGESSNNKAKGKKKGGKKKNQPSLDEFEEFGNFDGLDNNIIENMISESQPLPIAHNNQQEAAPQQFMSQPLSPKGKKILKRISLLN